jgi:germination protein M
MRKLIPIITLLAILSACGGSPAGGGTAEVYYAVVMTNQAQPPPEAVRAVSVRLPEGEDGLIFSAERMVRDPDDDALRSAFPDGVGVLGVRREGSRAVFVFSKEWLGAAGLDKTLAEYCMMKTALQFEGVTAARWEAEDADGKLVAGPVLREEAYIDTPLELVPAWYEIKLYFADEEGRLASETRPAILRESESAEWYRQVVNGLIAGPQTSGLLPVMPGRTRLLSVTVETRVCYVNVSRAFVVHAAGDTESARLTLRALVQSLTEMQGVSYVKIRVEGEERDDYFGVDISAPLERDGEM